ncbi:growth-regulated alpha protein [Mus caroli]|uniref:C-X-C motif chemokine n=1 Tax=Mus caroli TaxID=10089 RepID=A0A6P5PSN2_MUSCR|nr:growth-regulated alpha protein [Mus caroli]
MIPATRSLLCAALLLLATSHQATGAPVANELRCQCLQTMAGIHLKNIQSLKVLPSGPHCTQTEVIATLKNGRETCLDPEAPLVQKIVQKMLKGVPK